MNWYLYPPHRGYSYGGTTDACEQRFNRENLTATLEVG
jgi:hypothetical protein